MTADGDAQGCASVVSVAMYNSILPVFDLWRRSQQKLKSSVGYYTKSGAWCLASWCVVQTLRMKSDFTALGRLRRRGKLLDEIVDAALDLLDVELGLVHARFELVDASHVGEPLEKHIPQGTCRPLPETRALERLYSVTNGNDNIKVVNRQRAASRDRGFRQNLPKTLLR